MRVLFRETSMAPFRIDSNRRKRKLSFQYSILWFRLVQDPNGLVQWNPETTHDTRKETVTPGMVVVYALDFCTQTMKKSTPFCISLLFDSWNMCDKTIIVSWKDTVVTGFFQKFILPACCCSMNWVETITLLVPVNVGQNPLRLKGLFFQDLLSP